jgi:3-oxoacyl-[acyl-carrier protein] reductase
LHGRVALVTGAGRGIGRATALKLASDGAALVLNDVDGGPLEETVEAVRASGGSAVGLAADVTADDFADRFVGLAEERFGRVDIVVANAGYAWNGRLATQTDQQWSTMIDTHATSAFRLVRSALPSLLRVDPSRPRHGKIVLVSSIAAVHGAAAMASYAAAKGAVGGLVRSLAQELGPDAINVNAVAFGFTSTRLTQAVPDGASSIVEVAGSERRLGYRASARDAVVSRIPLGRPGTVEEAAGAIWFLCIPESDYVTGQTLTCSGGLYV